MGNQQNRVADPISSISGGVVGAELLPALKAAMISQNVFKAMFGDDGKRIFFDKVPSYNETITPGIELYWKDETFQNWDTYLMGTLSGTIFLPTKLQGDVNAQRSIAAAFSRFIGSDKHNLFEVVPGLIEFGLNMNFRYDRILVLDGGTLAGIDVTIPFKFDMKRLTQMKPDIDYHDDLDADLVGWIETIGLIVKDDNQHVFINGGVILETGK